MNTCQLPALSILMVEDEIIVQIVHRKIAEMLGHKIDIAENAQEALAMYDKGYDVIIMDIGLPDGNGIDVSAQIRRQENKDQRIPIIAITGYPLHEIEARCLAAGIDAVLEKPINAEILKNTLNQVKLNCLSLTEGV